MCASNQQQNERLNITQEVLLPLFFQRLYGSMLGNNLRQNQNMQYFLPTNQYIYLTAQVISQVFALCRTDLENHLRFCATASTIRLDKMNSMAQRFQL